MRDTFDEYRKQLDQIRLTDSGKRALMDSLRAQMREPVHRPHRGLRTALVAACVCLALVGTAFAATGGFGIFLRQNGDGSVTWEYREKLFPGDAVTDEVSQKTEESRQNMEEGDPVVREVMGSWQEIQERTGIDLIDSPLLDGAEQFNYWPKLQCYSVAYWPDLGMTIDRMHIIDGVKVTLEARPRVNGLEGADGDVYSYEFTVDGPVYAAGAGDALEQKYQEPCYLADGTPVYYYTIEPGSGETIFQAEFIYNGVSYSMKIEDAERAKLAAGAGAENASTEQFRADPDTDYEGVFFRVLDSFLVD